MNKKSTLLVNTEDILIVLTPLAVLIGDREAIALQQIHYWLEVNRKAAKTDTHLIDNQWWTFNTWAEWREGNFPFWSVATIQRVFESLSNKGLIVMRDHEKRNKGKWVTICYETLDELSASKVSHRKRESKRVGSGQIDTTSKATGSSQTDKTGHVKLTRLPSQTDKTTGTTETTETTTRYPLPRTSRGEFTASKFYLVSHERRVIFTKPYTRDDAQTECDRLKEYGVIAMKGSELNAAPDQYAGYERRKPHRPRSATFDAFGEGAFNLPPGFDTSSIGKDGGRIGKLVHQLASHLGRTFNDIVNDEQVAARVRAYYQWRKNDDRYKNLSARDPLVFLGEWRHFEEWEATKNTSPMGVWTEIEY